MFDKLMNRYYYGKSGKGDYTPEDLPQTRWQLFWEMLRIRLASIVKLNLLYMLFWIPAMFVIGRGIVQACSAIGNLSAISDQVAAGEAAAADLNMSMADIGNVLKGILFQTLIFLIPCITLTGPFTAAASLITRNWARDEHSFLWSDFWETVKANWKQSLLCSFITSLVPVMIYICTAFYGQMSVDNKLFIVPEALCIMLGVMWLCAVMYMYPQIVTYDLSFKNVVKNSFLMAIARLPFTLGLKLLSIVPAILLTVFIFFSNWIIALLVYGAYYAVIGFALSRFVNASYTNGQFDKYINSRIEGAEVNRGLYTETDDDDEKADNGEDADNN